jgi:hypothetical protein
MMPPVPPLQGVQRGVVKRATRRYGKGMMDMPTSQSPLRIGTRGSALALAQAHETRARLMAAHDLPALASRSWSSRPPATALPTGR